jgi:hypothetical protein
MTVPRRPSLCRGLASLDGPSGARSQRVARRSGGRKPPQVTRVLAICQRERSCFSCRRPADQVDLGGVSVEPPRPSVARREASSSSRCRRCFGGWDLIRHWPVFTTTASGRTGIPDIEGSGAAARATGRCCGLGRRGRSEAACDRCSAAQLPAATPGAEPLPIVGLRSPPDTGSENDWTGRCH